MACFAFAALDSIQIVVQEDTRGGGAYVAATLQASPYAAAYRLAQQLEAEVHVLEGPDPIGAIMRFAHEQRITQIFVGHSAPDRWKEMWSRSPVDRLIQAADDIDLRIFPHLLAQ